MVEVLAAGHHRALHERHKDPRGGEVALFDVDLEALRHDAAVHAVPGEEQGYAGVFVGAHEHLDGDLLVLGGGVAGGGPAFEVDGGGDAHGRGQDDEQRDDDGGVGLLAAGGGGLDAGADQVPVGVDGRLQGGDLGFESGEIGLVFEQGCADGWGVVDQGAAAGGASDEQHRKEDGDGHQGPSAVACARSERSSRAHITPRGSASSDTRAR